MFVFVSLCAIVFGNASETVDANDGISWDEILQKDSRTFLTDNCLECHQGAQPDGGLDLSDLVNGHAEGDRLGNLVRIIDRVRSGEMPPAEADQPDDTLRSDFVTNTTSRLVRFQKQLFASEGRVRGRRLTNLQLERTLHDLLGIDIPLVTLMSEEPRTDGFATVASGQSMSHFQLDQHLKVVDAALAESFRRSATVSDEWTRDFSAEQVARQNPQRRCREPEMIGDLAVVWSSRLIFYGRLPATTAPQDGWYRFHLTISARRKPKNHGVWCTVRSGPCVSSAPLLNWVTAFEASDEPRTLTFDAWLPAGHMLEVRPGDSTLKMARFSGGQVGAGEGDPQDVAGVNLHSLTMARVHHGATDAEIRKRLFGDLHVQATPDKPERNRRQIGSDRQLIQVQTNNRESDLRDLMRSFIGDAFRRPVSDEDAGPFIESALNVLRGGQPFAEAVRMGYRSVLCSPRFLYLNERPGLLDDYSLASRLSYFLWNGPPDRELLLLADRGELQDPGVLDGQIDRMLSHPRGAHFVTDFASEWLDLRLIDFTEPDPRLYPAFDVIVQQAMLNETHAYLQEMFDRNESIQLLIDSDHTYLDSRLARFYGIENVYGDGLQRIDLKPEHHRGGILTQGAVLKVTANGTTTSPVTRGVWIGERLLGEEIPPPPQGVPAIEPDIRGATSIRELLAKHRNNDSCASCHVKIDPPGFALENYDPSGRYRETYATGGRANSNRAVRIDASYDMADGQHFHDTDEFRTIVQSRPESLARNFAAKLLTKGTGATVQFADRQDLDSIVESTRIDNFGVKSILKAVVRSAVFRSK
ncbi:MAG: DUF1592 domain-containing protein [Planctomycetaceae bacterium]|nr:DUF1592 domain-containing protein [Planctomycetaceae bacterium]